MEEEKEKCPNCHHEMHKGTKCASCECTTS